MRPAYGVGSHVWPWSRHRHRGSGGRLVRVLVLGYEVFLGFGVEPSGFDVGSPFAVMVSKALISVSKEAVVFRREPKTREAKEPHERFRAPEVREEEPTLQQNLLRVYRNPPPTTDASSARSDSGRRASVAAQGRSFQAVNRGAAGRGV